MDCSDCVHASPGHLDVDDCEIDLMLTREEGRIVSTTSDSDEIETRVIGEEVGESCAHPGIIVCDDHRIPCRAFRWGDHGLSHRGSPDAIGRP